MDNNHKSKPKKMSNSKPVNPDAGEIGMHEVQRAYYNTVKNEDRVQYLLIKVDINLASLSAAKRAGMGEWANVCIEALQKLRAELIRLEYYPYEAQ